MSPIVDVQGVSRSFGGVQALEDVSFSLDAGSITGLIGPNGAGKTTLLNVVTGFFPPTSGRVTIDGSDVTGKRPHVLAAAGVARTYQNLLLLDEETVADNVLMGRHLAERHKEGRHRSAAAVQAVLDRVDMRSAAQTVVAGLPYGLRRRVEIARALATEPKVLILDEPTAGMTSEESRDIAALIHQVRAEGVTVLLVEHNVRLVTDLCDEVLVLDWGHLIARAAAGSVWDIEAVRVAYLGRAASHTASGTSAAPPADGSRGEGVGTC